MNPDNRPSGPQPARHMLTEQLERLSRGVESGTTAGDSLLGLIKVIEGMQVQATTGKAFRAQNPSALDEPLVRVMAGRLGAKPYREALAEALAEAGKTPLDEVPWAALVQKAQILLLVLQGAQAPKPVEPKLASPRSDTDVSLPVALPPFPPPEEGARSDLLQRLRSGLALLTEAERPAAEEMLRQANLPDNEWCAGCDAILQALVVLAESRASA